MNSLIQGLPQPPQFSSQSITEAKRDYLRLLEEKENRRKLNHFATLFPDTGEFRRELYPKHLEFFKNGAVDKERLFMAGNRVGKTVAGGYESTCHLTGCYPHWWEGRRFDKPVDWLAAGVTGLLTKNTIQKKLLGPSGEIGTGIIPGRKIIKLTRKMGISDAYEEIQIRHITGGISRLWLRSYEQGREIFQGFEQDGIWVDEECPTDVYEEALVRTMTTRGIMMMTYTPLKGQTELTMRFLESGK